MLWVYLLEFLVLATMPAVGLLFKENLILAGFVWFIGVSFKMLALYLTNQVIDDKKKKVESPLDPQT